MGSISINAPLCELWAIGHFRDDIPTRMIMVIHEWLVLGDKYGPWYSEPPISKADGSEYVQLFCIWMMLSACVWGV